MSLGPNSRPLRERVYKRNPLARDAALQLDASQPYAPPKRRSAMIRLDVPAQGALTSNGGVYFPPSGGAIVKSCLLTPDTGSSGYKWGLGADLSTSGALGAGFSIRPEFPDTELRGQFDAWGFFGIGDLCGNVSQGVISYPEMLVMPGEWFTLALTADNLIAEGYLHVIEFLEGDEDL